MKTLFTRRDRSSQRRAGVEARWFNVKELFDRSGWGRWCGIHDSSFEVYLCDFIFLGHGRATASRYFAQHHGNLKFTEVFIILCPFPAILTYCFYSSAVTATRKVQKPAELALVFWITLTTAAYTTGRNTQCKEEHMSIASLSFNWGMDYGTYTDLCTRSVICRLLITAQ